MCVCVCVHVWTRAHVCFQRALGVLDIMITYIVLSKIRMGVLHSCVAQW